MIVVHKAFARLMLILGILSNTLPRYAHFDNIMGRKVYYVGQALSFVCILLAGMYNERDKKTTLLFEFTLWLALNNLTDELFFDPTKLGWNEIVFSLILFIWLIIKLKRWSNRNQNS